MPASSYHPARGRVWWCLVPLQMSEPALWASLPDELARLLHVPIERREIPVTKAVFEGMVAKHQKLRREAQVRHGGPQCRALQASWGMVVGCVPVLRPSRDA